MANDLARAASFISSAKTPNNAREIEGVMKRHPIRYSINNLLIAQNGDAATISFFFGVDDLPNKSSWVSWAVLKRGDAGWVIEAAPTRALVGASENPFYSFVSLLRPATEDEQLREPEPRNLRASVIRFALLGFALDNGGKFPLQPFQIREKVLPYYPALDGLGRFAQSQPPLSFNTKLNGMALSKLQKSQTVMLYEGANEQLDFGSDGRALVVLVAGNTRFVNARNAKMLRWSP